ncbi:MAG TPA: GNAT family N-acetyltransferase, partial [Streptomyces sp.]|nr:GNAT family N-acetyltransferase [Streptomyces sp.]
MIEIRTVTSDDWALWRELRLAALTEAPHAFGSRLADWQGAGDREERWRARLDIPGARHFV